MDSPQKPLDFDGGCDLKELFTAKAAFREGDFIYRLHRDWTGLPGKIADAFNDIIAQEEKITREFVRTDDSVGKQGKLTQRAHPTLSHTLWTLIT